MPSTKLKHRIAKQDFYGPAVALNFNGSPRAQSIVGGVCSILTKLFLLLLALYKLWELIFSRSPRISTIESAITVSNANFTDMNLGLMLTFNHFANGQSEGKLLKDP